MIDSEFTIRKLEILATFIENGNINKTAEILNLSAVSVHRALHTLEETMRCVLFTRQGRALIPTPAALTLAHYAKQIILLANDGIDATRRTAGYANNRLQLGCLYSLSNETVPALIIALKQRRPNLDINLTMDSNSNLLKMLADNKIDAALVAINDATALNNDIEQLPLFEDELCLAVSNDYREPVNNPCDLKDFDGARFVGLTEGFATTYDMALTFKNAGITPKIITRLDNILSLMNMVKAGVGHAIVPSRIVTAFGQSIRFVHLTKSLANTQQITLVFNKNRERDPDILALIAQSRMLMRERKVQTN